MEDAILDHFGFNVSVAFHHWCTFFRWMKSDGLGAAQLLGHSFPLHETNTDIN
jgi:hypothetical protein